MFDAFASDAGLARDMSGGIDTYFATRHPWLQGLVLTIFATINSVRVLAYIPQIVKAARDQNGATAISKTTWGLFLASHLTTIAYAVVCLGDLIMAVIFLGNAMACFAIVLITVLKHRGHRPEAIPIPDEVILQALRK